MSDRSTVFIASGNYSRFVEVKIDEGTCFECKYKKNILVFDNSDDEYTPIKFCIDCLKDFHEGKVSKSTWENDVSNV